MPLLSKNDVEDLGPCCGCGKTGQDVRNIILLPVRGTVPGQGWGCYACGLPTDGAVSVACDTCWEAKAPLSACVGYSKLGQRIDVALLTEPHKHDPAWHPEMQQEDINNTEDEDVP